MCLLPLRISLCVFMVGCMIQFLPYGWIQYTDFHWVHQVYCWVCSSICGHCGHFYILAFVDEKHESVDISYVPIRISLDIYQVGDTMTILRPFPGWPIPQIIFCFFSDWLPFYHTPPQTHSPLLGHLQLPICYIAFTADFRKTLRSSNVCIKFSWNFYNKNLSQRYMYSLA